MPKTRMIKFRITPEQHHELLVRARASNALSVAAYLRQLAFQQPLLYDKLCEQTKLVREVLALQKSKSL
jgi:hypothetical protein